MSIFSSVPMTKISRSSHNLSHQVKASFDAGGIYPMMCELAFPGDSWKVGLEQFIRTMPMIAPLMDTMDVKVDAFFVPLRLIWDDWTDFISLGPSGDFSAVRPTINTPSLTPDSDGAAICNKLYSYGSLSDYLNFPSTVFTSGVAHPKVELDALPFRAYQLIWNEYYRNENLDPEIPIEKSSGSLTLEGSVSPSSPAYVGHFYVKQRGWNKDYFTSSLPTPQKGPAVKIPYGDIDISDDGEMRFVPSSPDNPFSPSDVDEDLNVGTEVETNLGHTFGRLFAHNNDTSHTVVLKYDEGLKASLNSGSLPTIEELRYAEVLQEYYEANARGGTRYKEYQLNIWHTPTKDSRLDRPEYLGGYRGPITISDVDQTSQSATTAQGTLAGKGVSSGGNRLFRYRVPEWGIIMITLSVAPKSSYYQGYRKWNLYNDVFDWPNPFFANLGEQEILNKEIYTADDGDDNDTFGYTPRYAEAKFIPSSVHGQFRSTLDYWHLSRKFGSRPHLNSAFLHIQSSEVERAFPLQVSGSNKFVGTFFFHVQRKMYLPYWGVPRLIHSL